MLDMVIHPPIERSVICPYLLQKDCQAIVVVTINSIVFSDYFLTVWERKCLQNCTGNFQISKKYGERKSFSLPL